MNFKNIKFLVMDFDGVMTDNTFILDENGKESARCNRADGYGIKVLKKLGIELLVISTEKIPIVKRRCEKLKIPCYYNVHRKLDIFLKEIKKRKIDVKNTCYVGNDINDIECIKKAGIGIAVKDAYPEVKKVADYITKKRGGKGVIREIADLIAGKNSINVDDAFNINSMRML